MSKSVGRPKGSKKTRKNNRDLEEEEDLDLEEEELDDLDLDDLSDDDLSDEDLSDDDLDEGVRKRREPSISKEINKMINNTIKDIKDGDMAVPAIGIGLVAIIGFAIYKGAKL
jgi:hypothetical protein